MDYWVDADKGHSLSKAVFRNLRYSLDALGAYLTPWGYGALLLWLVPLVASPWRRRCGMLATVIAGVIVAHFFITGHGVVNGQARYYSEAMPMMMVLAAAGLILVRFGLARLCRWLGVRGPVQTARAACWLAVAVLTVSGLCSSFDPLLQACQCVWWNQAGAIRDLAQAQKSATAPASGEARRGEDSAQGELDNALVFVSAPGYYRNCRYDGQMDLYLWGFMLNDPDLAGRVVYARDRGPAENTKLIAAYPGRRTYWVAAGPGSHQLIHLGDLHTRPAP